MSDSNMVRHLANLSRNQAREAKTAFLRNLSLQEAAKWDSLAAKMEQPQTYAEWKAALDRKEGI